VPTLPHHRNQRPGPALPRLPPNITHAEGQGVVSSWEERIARRLTGDGSVIVPPRFAAWLEDKAGLTAERRLMLRDTDQVAYEVLAALRLAALAHRSGNGTKMAAPQPVQPQSESWLTTSQAAQLAGVTDRCIRKWIAQHRLPATRHGERWLINPAHLHLMTT
jgi:excisionase family DNA binding protein